MTQRDPQLLLQAAPFLRRGVTTRGLMFEVVLGLTPVVLAAIWFFGLSAIDPSTTVVMPAVPLFAPGQRGSIVLPIPADPRLLGGLLTFQAMVFHSADPSDARLTGFIDEVVR